MQTDNQPVDIETVEKPSPALANPAIARCANAWEVAYQEQIEDDESEYFALKSWRGLPRRPAPSHQPRQLPRLHRLCRPRHVARRHPDGDVQASSFTPPGRPLRCRLRRKIARNGWSRRLRQSHRIRNRPRQKIPAPAQQDRMKKMRNITVSVPETAYLRARVWCAERDGSLSALVAHLLETLPNIGHTKVHHSLRTQAPQPGSEKPIKAPAHGFPVPQSLQPPPPPC